MWCQAGKPPPNARDTGPRRAGNASCRTAAVTLERPLAGRRVLVTGGAKRIGRAIALVLAEAGADVAITFRGSKIEAQQTVDLLLNARGESVGA
jgi:NADPH:quinone reductase-like Zn-dependent oxidoreductase